MAQEGHRSKNSLMHSDQKYYGRSGSPGKKDYSQSLRQDYSSIFILLILYILQGIPLGLSGSIPLILQNYGVSYSEQAIFSLVTWPFRYDAILLLRRVINSQFFFPSLKLLWAPIVDSYYSVKFGRRKSWLIPVQYVIGLCLLVLSFLINTLLGRGLDASNHIKEDSSNASSPNVYLLTLIFSTINFLCATQDIAVDGWALTMLSKQNVVYGSTCNTVGQTVGFTLGYLVFLSLESPEVCNKYFRSIPQKEGMVTLSGKF